MALGVIRAARELGLSVPGDLAVVGFDDAPLAAHADPPLTTVRQDKFGIGAAAATALVGMIESEAAPPPALVLPVELVVRRSCGATLAVTEREVERRYTDAFRAPVAQGIERSPPEREVGGSNPPGRMRTRGRRSGPSLGSRPCRRATRPACARPGRR